MTHYNFNDTLPQKAEMIKWADEASQGEIPLSSEGDPEIDICIKLIRNEVPPEVDQHRKIQSEDLRTAIKVPIDTIHRAAKMYPSMYHKLAA